MQAGENVNCPRYDPRQIARALNHLDPALTPECIANPQPERLWAIFRALLIHEYEILEESLNYLPLSAEINGDIESDLFRNVTPLCVLYRAMTTVYNDFFDFQLEMHDLIEPDRERTRIMLSLVVQLLDTFGRLEGPMEQLEQSEEQESRQYKDALIQAEGIERKLAEERREEAARMRRENQLSEDTHKLITELKSQKQRADELGAINEKAEEEKKHEEEKKMEYEERNKELAQKEKDLQDSIVDDLQLILKQKEEQLELRNEVRDGLQKSKQDVEDIRNDREALRKTAALLDTAKQNIADLRESSNKFGQENLELINLESMLDHVRTDIDACAEDLRTIEIDMVAAHRAHTAALQNHRADLATIEAKILELEGELAQLKASGAKESSNQLIRDKQGILASLRNQLVKNRRATEEEILEFARELQAAQQQFLKASNEAAKVVMQSKAATDEVHSALMDEEIRGLNGSIVQLSSPNRTSLSPSRSMYAKLTGSSKKAMPKLKFDDSSFHTSKSISNEDSTLAPRKPLQESMSNFAPETPGKPIDRKSSETNSTINMCQSFTGPLGHF